MALPWRDGCSWLRQLPGGGTLQRDGGGLGVGEVGQVLGVSPMEPWDPSRCSLCHLGSLLRRVLSLYRRHACERGLPCARHGPKSKMRNVDGSRGERRVLLLSLDHAGTGSLSQWGSHGPAPWRSSLATQLPWTAPQSAVPRMLTEGGKKKIY